MEYNNYCSCLLNKYNKTTHKLVTNLQNFVYKKYICQKSLKRRYTQERF